jgi:hypothetical protein
MRKDNYSSTIASSSDSKAAAKTQNQTEEGKVRKQEANMVKRLLSFLLVAIQNTKLPFCFLYSLASVCAAAIVGGRITHKMFNSTSYTTAALLVMETIYYNPSKLGSNGKINPLFKQLKTTNKPTATR